MFVATLSNGKTIVEGKDVPHFDACPDGIISMQLIMPYAITKYVGNQTLKRNALITIGRYDKYYYAKQAIANIMSISGAGMQGMPGGQGQITHEVLAGIDDARKEVYYFTINTSSGDIAFDRFDYDSWLKQYTINPDLFKKGSPRS